MFNPKTILSRIMHIEPKRRQSIVSLITILGLTIIGFISTMYFAHTVSKDILGIYYLFLAYYGILNLIGDAGFGGATVKRISEGKDQNQFFSAFIMLRVLLLTISITALLVARPLLMDLDQHGMFYWLMIALVIGVFFSIVSNGNYGSGKVGINQTCGFLNSAIRIIIQVIAVFLGYYAVGLAGGFVFGMIAGTIISQRFLNLHITSFKSYHLKSLFSFSFWIFLSSSGLLVFGYMDTILIGYFLDNTDVAVYRIAFQLTTAATFTTLAIRTVLYPNISNWSAHNQYSRIEYSLTKGFTYSLLLALPVFVGGLLLGDRLLYFFYGASFVQGTQALYILLAAQVANVFMFLQTMCLNAMNRPKDSFKITAVASIANILMNLILIPDLGITGASIATLLSITLNAVLAYYILRKIIKVQVEYSSLRNILISLAVMGMFIGIYCLIVPLSTVWLTLIPILVGGIIYGVILIKLDKKIYNELQDILVKMGIVSPQ